MIDSKERSPPHSTGGLHLNFGTELKNFPAILKTPEGKTLEYGTASICVEDQSLDFSGEFVPICKMGTCLQIIRTQKDFETQQFTGKVYLSTQRMLRLVSITDEILSGAMVAYNYDTEMDGRVVASVVREDVPSRFSLLHKQMEHFPSVEEFPVKINTISLAQIRFICNKTLSMHQRITLSTELPIRLNSLHMEIVQPVIFGPSEASSYLCRILNLSEENYETLSSFVRKISVRENKLFPPVVTSSEAVRL